MQVDPIKPTLKAPKTHRLKLQYDKVLSSFAFKFNMSRYTKATQAVYSWAFPTEEEPAAVVDPSAVDGIGIAEVGTSAFCSPRHVFHRDVNPCSPRHPSRCKPVLATSSTAM